MRKFAKPFAIVALIALAGWLTFWLIQQVRIRNIPGIYLAEGGLGYLVIEKQGGVLRVAEPELLPDLEGTAQWFTHPEIKLRLPGMRFSSDWNPTGRADLGLKEPEASQQKGRGWIVDVMPSNKIAGDFDLAGFRDPDNAYSSVDLAKPPGPVVPTSCPSYLHRVNDSRIPLYFQTQRQAKDPVRAQAIALELLEALPGDLHIRALYMEAALKAGDFAELGNRVNEWRDAFAASENLYLKRMGELGDYMVKSKTLTDAGGNAHTLIENLIEPRGPGLGSKGDLAAWMAGLPEILKCTDFMYAPTELNPAWRLGANYLDVQVFAKVTRLGAVYLMFQGRREEALRLLEAGLRNGAWRARHGLLIDRLIGVAAIQIQLSGLSLYALNACETENELVEAARVLDRFKDLPDESKDKDFGLFLSPPFEDIQGFVDLGEGEERYRHAVTRMRLLRAGIAARRRLIAEGSYPAKPGDFDAWLTGGLPRDPFGEGAVRFEVKPDELVLRSVGPDGIDEMGAIEYDPTNGLQGQGSHSGGDVVLRVPKVRQYPFPREGTKASSPDDLRRQYPNGLPVDGFARTKNRPLGISAGPPLRIYSFGPNNDESSAATRGVGDAYQVEVMYDPTNGLTSSGDLFIEIPQP